MTDGVAEGSGPGNNVSAVDPDGDVVVVQNADDTFTVFGALAELAGAVPVNPQVVQMVLAALGRHLGDNGAEIGQRVFAMRPEDYQWFDNAWKMNAGDGFVRGTLRNADGKITRQVAIKEVNGLPAQAAQIDPMMLLVAGQLASIQQQLDRIEDRLETIGFDVQRGIELLERDQAAEAVSAVTIIGEVYANFVRAGVTDATDWSRAAPLEHIIRKRHVAVVKEMEAIASDFVLDGDVRHDKQVLKKIKAQRWQTLLTQETMLRQAGLQWVTIYGDRKRQEGHDDLEALNAFRERNAVLAEQANTAAQRVLDAGLNAPQTRPRPEWRQLYKDGLVLGGMRDKDAIDKITALRQDLVQISREAPTVALDAPPEPTIRLGVAGTTPTAGRAHGR